MKNFKIDTHAFNPIETHILKSTGDKYHIGLLCLADIDTVEAFHNHIADTLVTSEKSFFLSKPRSFFEQHLSPHNDSAVIGAVMNGNLIAQAIIHHPSKENPKTGMVDMKPIAPPEKVTVFQGIGVAPVCRGNAVTEKLTSVWLKYARGVGREHALAEIEVRNIASWNSLLKGGLDIVSLGRDPSDGAVLYNAHATVESVRGVTLECRIETGLRTPLTGRMRGRVERHPGILHHGVLKGRELL